MRAMISALVISNLPSFSQLRAKPLTDPGDQLSVQGVDLRIGQRPVLRSIRNRVGQTLLALRHRRSLILIEYLDLFDKRMVELFFDPVNQSLRRKAVIQHDSQIPLNRRKSSKGTNLKLPRSILNQLLKVNFKYEKGRQAKLLAEIRVELAQAAYVGTRDLERRGLSRVENGGKALARPNHLRRHADQLQDPFHQPFDVEESRRRLLLAAQAPALPVAVDSAGQTLPLLGCPRGAGGKDLAEIEAVKPLGLLRDLRAQAFHQARDEAQAHLGILLGQRFRTFTPRPRPAPQAGKTAERESGGQGKRG